MRLRSVHGHEVDAYVLSSFDEHQKFEPDDDDSRLKFISGFSGPVGDAVVSLFCLSIFSSHAMRTDSKRVRAIKFNSHRKLNTFRAAGSARDLNSVLVTTHARDKKLKQFKQS